MKLKPERGGARNAKRGEDILNGENSLSKGPEVGKSLLFSGIEKFQALRLEKWAERRVRCRTNSFLSHLQ